MDRFSRLGIYGNDENHSQVSAARLQSSQIDWDMINWGLLQSQCFDRNADRYYHKKTDLAAKHALPLSVPEQENLDDPPNPSSSPRQYKERSAVVLRAYHDMEWTENIKQYIRSFIMELSLHSGAEYEVFILCHVRNNSISLNAKDIDSLRSLKAQFIPAEFLDMTVLWNAQTLESWYPKLEEHRYLPLRSPVSSCPVRLLTARFTSTGNQLKYSPKHFKSLIITGSWNWIPG